MLNFFLMGPRRMVEFDYYAAAELFPTRRRSSGRQSFGYKRFAQASQAIRFAIEDMPPECLSAHFSKSMSKDTVVTISAVYTKAPNIL
jgi:hypothetical protein